MAKKRNTTGLKPPYKPGQSGNPAGRKSAGAYLREELNSLVYAQLTEDQVRRIARNKKESINRRAAAERILRLVEVGDLADFAGLLRGENSLEDLRGMGINTEVVKKFKQKTRKEVTGAGEDADVEEIIEREIELFDRAGLDFDRIADQTAGKPMQPTEHTGEITVTIRPMGE